MASKLAALSRSRLWIFDAIQLLVRRRLASLQLLIGVTDGKRGLINCYGAFLGLYKVHLLEDTDADLLSLIGSLQTFLVLLLAPFVSRLLDARYHYAVGSTGSLLNFLGYFAISFAAGDGGHNAGRYWIIQLCSVVVGLGQACFFTYSAQNAVQWFPKQQVVVIGIISSGAAFGGVVYTIGFKVLMAQFGAPVGLKIFASLVACTSAISAGAAGPPPNLAGRPISKVFRLDTWIDLSPFHDPPFRWFTASLFLMFLGLFALPFYVTVWAQSNGLGAVEDIRDGTGELAGVQGLRSFWFLVIINGSSAIGRVGAALIATRLLSPLHTQALGHLLSGVLPLLFWPLSRSTAPAVVFAVLYGISSGAGLSLAAACVSALRPKRAAERMGCCIASMYAAVALSALSGPVVAGRLVNAFGVNVLGYWTGGLLLAAASCVVVASRSLILSRERRV